MSGTASDAVARPVPEELNPFEGEAGPQADNPYVQGVVTMMHNMMRQHAEQMQAMERKFEEENKELREALEMS